MKPAHGRSEAFAPIGPLRGTAAVPGDKSISHRALILAALAVGESRIARLNDGADVAATASALRALGARVERDADGSWTVAGAGVGALLQPQAPLDCGNSATTARLLAGLLAAHPVRAILTGDESLSRRPMERVAAPLRRAGGRIATAPGGTLPLLVEGVYPLVPCRHRLEIASAQLKSALLLAALNTPGVTEIVEPVATRDHSERLLRLFGAEIEAGEGTIRLRGEAELLPQRLELPGDPSAAAFLAAAAAIVPGSEVRIEGVCANPRRTGFFRILEAMGAELRWSRQREQAGEPVADLVVRHSALRGVDVPPELASDTIDEYPILFVVAAFAEGTTRARGLAELRVKESDRLAAMAAGLGAAGVRIEEREDGLAVHGAAGAPIAGGASLDARGDHRVAMAFAVAGLRSKEPIGIRAMASAAASFPGFSAALEALAGA